MASALSRSRSIPDASRRERLGTSSRFRFCSFANRRRSMFALCKALDAFHASCAAWYSAKRRRLTASSRTSVLFFGSGPDGSAGAGASRSRYGSVRKPLRQSVGIGRGALPWTVRCEAMRGARGRWVAFDAYLDSRRCLHAQSSELSDAPARAPPCNVHPQPRRAHGNAREASSAHS